MSRSSFVRRALALGWLALLLAHAGGWLQLRPLDALDAALYDLRLRAFANERTDSRIAVVDIDEKALAEVGRWPWPRERLAALVDRLAGPGGALLVGLDVLLAEPGDAAGDAALAAALARHPVVLGLHLDASTGAARSGVLPPSLPAAPPSALPPSQGHAGNLPAFAQAAAGAGFLNAVIDDDAVTRRAALVADYDGRLLPSFALAVARVVAGDRVLAMLQSADERGQVLIPYPPQAGRVRHDSAADVLAGRSPAGAWQGRIVLFGLTAAGLGDQHLAPTGALLPGVELHANLVGALLDGRLPHVPGWARAASLAALVLVGALLAFALPRLALLPASALAAALALLLALLDFGAWAAVRAALPLAAPLAAVAGLYALQLFFGQLAEALARRRLAALFGQYVPPELVAQMSRDPDRYSMEGRSAELTVLFADVRGFTTFSEKLTPTELAALMNRYFSVMTEVVRRHRGTLDKYVGDALMAFWGAPVDDPAHAQHAVQAALAMQAALPALNEEFAARGWPPIRITIGINTGPMVVGDMGSKHRRAYTVLGDAVNVAARLQELSGKLEVPVVVGEATAAALPVDWPRRELDRVQVRGRSAAMSIFEPLPR